MFSVLTNPNSSLDQVGLRVHPQLYRRIIIPKELKWEIRDKLDQANITERVIIRTRWTEPNGYDAGIPKSNHGHVSKMVIQKNRSECAIMVRKMRSMVIGDAMSRLDSTPMGVRKSHLEKLVFDKPML